ncbi:MAG TPA: hypothetical protein VMT35_16760 [Ignavibacteriaceae bacterium]|nr:hypothetical protein [Ignavibacteriaceae bacterium]
MTDRKSILIIIEVFFFNALIYSQQSSLSKGVNCLSEFISSDYFKKIKNKTDDLSLVDTIYFKSLEFNKDDISEALLTLTFGTIPYKEIPIQIPLVKCIIHFPLISDNDSVFNLKNRNLPKDLLFDTPGDEFGDKDKLAHFFGSAFLSYNSRFFDFGTVFGYFVEVFEESFKVQSSIDNRDLMVNNLGRIFGKILRKNNRAAPSGMLLLNSLFYFRYPL